MTETYNNLTEYTSNWEFLLTIRSTTFYFIAKIDNTQILAVVFGVNSTRRKFKFWQSFLQKSIWRLKNFTMSPKSVGHWLKENVNEENGNTLVWTFLLGMVKKDPWDLDLLEFFDVGLTNNYKSLSVTPNKKEDRIFSQTDEHAN